MHTGRCKGSPLLKLENACDSYKLFACVEKVGDGSKLCDALVEQKGSWNRFPLYRNQTGSLQDRSCVIFSHGVLHCTRLSALVKRIAYFTQPSRVGTEWADGYSDKYYLPIMPLRIRSMRFSFPVSVHIKSFNISQCVRQHLSVETRHNFTHR